MSDMRPTAEQEKIINHELHQHARVLAVAGSGKTTTMVYRIHHLVYDLKQDAGAMRVVMFNRLARKQFEERLSRMVPDVGKRPKVLTFHSLAYSLWSGAKKRGVVPPESELWIGDKEELARIWMGRAMDSLVKEGVLETAPTDPKTALDFVGLWKASLIPPERAGHRTNPDLVYVYRRFEEYREQQGAMMFDDFIPKAMILLDSHPELRRLWTDRLDHLIVDEYQDVNFGQQQLIKLLAGSRADVMVVGDDDQTIYEWRGARPDYILREFEKDFANKPVTRYELSHSFRFGPTLAQAAHNVISFNVQRETKTLVANDPAQVTGFDIITEEFEQGTETDRQMAQQFSQLVQQHQVQPRQIAVLGRTYSQLDGLQGIFVRNRIPFRVVGNSPFFERDENRTLLDYVRLAQAWDAPARAMPVWRAPLVQNDPRELDESFADDVASASYKKQTPQVREAFRTVAAIANTPYRKITRHVLQRAIEQGHQQGLTIGRSLLALLDAVTSPVSAAGRETIEELLDFVQRIRERTSTEPLPEAGELLQWIIDSTRYEDHYLRLYGQDTASNDRLASIHNFVNFARQSGLNILEFVRYIAALDVQRGLPNDQVIMMTTIHRTKGLEFDYVFIPSCIEGKMPVLINEMVEVYDTSGQVPEQPLSPAIENERRLFYVAATRARKHLYIGTVTPPDRGLQGESTVALPSRFLDEARVEPTKRVVEAFQQDLADAGSGAKKPGRLTAALKQYATSGVIAKYVTDHYLDQLGDSTARDQALGAIRQTTEVPFQYSYDYADIQITGHKSNEPNPSPPTWTNPWEGIGVTL